MATFDRNAKSNLYKVYEEIEDIVKSKHFFPEINEELTAEFGDIVKLVHKQKADVCEDICPIVITGLYLFVQCYRLVILQVSIRLCSIVFYF